LQNIFVLLDDHCKHTKISEAVQLARASGVIMLSLPGHSSYRLQLLGVGFLRPANSHYEAEKYEVITKESQEIRKSGKCGNVVFLLSRLNSSQYGCSYDFLQVYRHLTGTQ